MTNSEKILHTHGLKKTIFRIELLELFMNSVSSVSFEDIKQKISTTSDKVTIYRALTSFEKQGLIHKVPDKSNKARYALCQEDCSSNKHIDSHAHFICKYCGDTFCINDMKVPKIKDSKGFSISTTNLTLEGKCLECQK